MFVPISPTPAPDWERFPGRLIVLSGASGSGKSTLVSRLLELHPDRLAISISATTRAPREGEIPGVSYHFTTLEEFGQRQYLEWAEVHGHLYGTPLDPLVRTLQAGRCMILVIDVQGAMQVVEKVPNALTIFVHAPDPETLEARLRARGTEDDATVRKRLANARGEVALADRYAHQILNDDLERAVDELAAILLQNHCGG